MYPIEEEPPHTSDFRLEIYVFVQQLQFVFALWFSNGVWAAKLTYIFPFCPLLLIDHQHSGRTVKGYI